MGRRGVEEGVSRGRSEQAEPDGRLMEWQARAGAAEAGWQANVLMYHADAKAANVLAAWCGCQTALGPNQRDTSAWWSVNRLCSLARPLMLGCGRLSM